MAELCNPTPAVGNVRTPPVVMRSFSVEPDAFLKWKELASRESISASFVSVIDPSLFSNLNELPFNPSEK